MLKLIAVALAALVAGAAPAFAHLNPAEHGSFLAGVSHPLTGLDHILAMVAVGLWAAQVGGRAAYAVPAAFVGTMVAGFLLGLAGLTLPFVEPMIAASVLVLGVLAASAIRLPVALGAAVVGLFALFHGIAHSAELGGAGAVSFGVGFVAATALLHAAGLAIGRAGHAGAVFGRLAGAGTAAAGLALMLS